MQGRFCDVTVSEIVTNCNNTSNTFTKALYLLANSFLDCTGEILNSCISSVRIRNLYERTMHNFTIDIHADIKKLKERDLYYKWILLCIAQLATTGGAQYKTVIV